MAGGHGIKSAVVDTKAQTLTLVIDLSGKDKRDSASGNSVLYASSGGSYPLQDGFVFTGSVYKSKPKSERAPKAQA